MRWPRLTHLRRTNLTRVFRRFGFIRVNKRRLYLCLCLFSIVSTISIYLESSGVFRWLSIYRWKTFSIDPRYSKYLQPHLPIAYEASQAHDFMNTRNLLQNIDPKSPENSKLIPAIHDRYQSYLRPVNTVFPRARFQLEPPRRRMLIENIIRTGYGLHPYITEKGESIWMENGIVYRPWKKPESVPGSVDGSNQMEYEAFVPFDEDLFFEGRKPDFRYKTEKKIIVWHTPANYVKVNKGVDPMKQCPDFPCRLATNFSLYGEKSSAVLFAAHAIQGNPPPRTSPDQVFILHNHEPQAYQRWQGDRNKQAWKSAFNWTFTYRMDSDVVLPYALLRKRPARTSVSPDGKDYYQIAREKSRAAAWMVTTCNTTGLRERYVAELQKYVQVDVYGQCGSSQCSRSYDDLCADEISRKYKFFLAFENAICPDYISEKTFRFLTRDILVVARGSDGYYQHLPSETFINTNDFPSPKKLAEFLSYLDNNQEAYISALKAKESYTAIFEDYPMREPDGSISNVVYLFQSVPMCLVCQRLWNLDKHAKKIEDIREWFDRRTCQFPPDLGFMANVTAEKLDPFLNEENDLRRMHEKAKQRAIEKLRKMRKTSLAG